MTFRLRGWAVRDDHTVLFVDWLDPEPGALTEHTITLTDDEARSARKASAMRALVTQKLRRKLLGADVAATLNPLVGESFTI